MRLVLPAFMLALAGVLSMSAGCSGGDPTQAAAAPLPPPPAEGGTLETPDAGGLPGSDAGAGVDAPADAGPLPDGRETDATPPSPPPDIDTIPWDNSPGVGYGVARKDTKNPLGDNVFIAYAGYQINLSEAEAWLTALYRASLEARGVRYVWAVQGPNNPTYTNQEIGNSKIAEAMVPLVDASTKFVLVAGHSSGSYVAHELLNQLDTNLDPQGVTKGKVVYFDLDGGQDGLSQPVVARLRKAYFVSSFDALTGTYSPNVSSMQSAASNYAFAGGYWQNDASQSGCDAGASWCVHVTLVTTRPHDPTQADGPLDYSDFNGRPVCHSYIDAKAAEAGLAP